MSYGYLIKIVFSSTTILYNLLVSLWEMSLTKNGIYNIIQMEETSGDSLKSKEHKAVAKRKVENFGKANYIWRENINVLLWHDIQIIDKAHYQKVKKSNLERTWDKLSNPVGILAMWYQLFKREYHSTIKNLALCLTQFLVMSKVNELLNQHLSLLNDPASVMLCSLVLDNVLA